MAGLQRSAVSFRRQGSSGLVWDDRFLSGELQKQEQGSGEGQHEVAAAAAAGEKQEINQESDVKLVRSSSVGKIERSRSNGGQRGGYRTGKVTPAMEPPSPRVSACGFCGAFGKAPKNHRKKAGKSRSR